MQHVLVALQYEKSSSHNIIIFVISLFKCPPALGAQDRRPPSARHCAGPTATDIFDIFTFFMVMRRQTIRP